MGFYPSRRKGYHDYCNSSTVTVDESVPLSWVAYTWRFNFTTLLNPFRSVENTLAQRDYLPQHYRTIDVSDCTKPENNGTFVVKHGEK